MEINNNLLAKASLTNAVEILTLTFLLGQEVKFVLQFEPTFSMKICQKAQ